MRAVTEEVVSRFGGIDVLVNNAAHTGRAHMVADSDVAHLDLGVWSQTLSINLTGAMLCSKHVVPHMVASGRGGSIINIGSVNQLLGFDHLTSYGASKAGLHALTQHLATQYGRGSVRANTVAPGFIITEAAEAYLRTSPVDARERRRTVPLPHEGRPDDIANAVAFFASESSRYITGQMLVVDGGQFAHAPHLDLDHPWSAHE